MRRCCLSRHDGCAVEYARRDNVTQFLDWAKSLGVSEAVLFEADDLVGVSAWIGWQLGSGH